MALRSHVPDDEKMLDVSANRKARSRGDGGILPAGRQGRQDEMFDQYPRYRPTAGLGINGSKVVALAEWWPTEYGVY